ncbi:Hypothetical protein SCF082_LOCUS52494 [Durusdinium trenchii]|uniref:Nuclear pore complex protein Nup160 n=1 Tax=Durusdinium trenchii TaxID=1381693 RepID=A0ABP0SLG6_9DINO
MEGAGREVPLVLFEDDRLGRCWETKELAAAGGGGAGTAAAAARQHDVDNTDDEEAEGEAPVVGAWRKPKQRQGAEDLAGCYFFQPQQGYSEDDRAACSKRMIFWRALGGTGTLDVLDVSLEQQVNGGAVHFRLSRGASIAKDGVQWFERDRKLFLCLAMTNGEALVLEFHSHPFAPIKSKLRCAPDESFLLQKQDRESIFRRSTSGRLDDIGACRWFATSNGDIFLASGASTIRCLKFSPGANRCETLVLSDDSLAQRFWPTSLARLKRTTERALGKPTESQGDGDQDHVVQIVPVCRGGSEYDDTFLLAFHANGKLRTWSMSQQTCTLELDVVELFHTACSQRSDTAPASSIVEQAWASMCQISGSTERNAFQLVVGLYLASGKALLMRLPATLTINQLSVESAVEPLFSEGTPRSLRGYRLIDLTTNPASELVSVWWKPESGKSTKTLVHSLDTAGQPSEAVPYDLNRVQMLEGDSPPPSENTHEFFFKRLDLPGRFSNRDLVVGFELCSGKNLSPSTASASRSEILRQMKAFAQDQQQATGDAWQRLLNDCENAWLQGHRPLSVSAQAATLVGSLSKNLVVRKSGVFGFRSADWPEEALLETPCSPDPKIRALVEASRRCERLLVELEDFGLHREGSTGFVDQLRRITADVPFVEVERALQPLCDLDLEADQLFGFLGDTLDSLAPHTPLDRPAPSSVEFTSASSDAEESVTPGKTLEAEVLNSSLQQTLQARSRLATCALFAVVMLAQGFPMHPRYFRPDAEVEAIRTVGVKACFTLSFALQLAGERPIKVPRSKDWIRRLTIRDAKPALPKLQRNASSVLGMWIEGLLVADATLTLPILVEHVARLEQEIVPFLDREQQYDVLRTVTKALLRSDGPPPPYHVLPFPGYETYFSDAQRDRSRYLRFLQAKCCIWEAVRGTSSSADMATEAMGFFQSATPVQAQCKYNIMVRQIFQHANQPTCGIEFALRALRNHELNQGEDAMEDDIRDVLCSNIFAHALEESNYRQALMAARLYPASEGPNEGNQYIGQLVSIMVERNEIEALCALPLQNYDEKAVWKDMVMSTLKWKTEEDVSLETLLIRDQPNYYHTFYTFCINHGRFNEAAMCMYTMAARIDSSVRAQRDGDWDLDHMTALQDALCSCLTTLRLTPLGAASIFVKYAIHFEDDEDVQVTTSKDVYLVTLAKIEQLYAVSCAASALLSNHLSSVRFAPSQLVSPLVHADLSDHATTLIKLFDLDATEMFQRLTARCLEGFESWVVLQAHLQTLDEVDGIQGFRYHTVVLEAMLTLKPDIEVPQWMIASFLSWGQFNASQRTDVNAFSRNGNDGSSKPRNAAALLRTLVKFGRLQQACTLAASVLRAMSHAFETQEAYQQPPWVPFKTLDIILLRAARDPSLAAELGALRSAVEDFAIEMCKKPVHNTTFFTT